MDTRHQILFNLEDNDSRILRITVTYSQKCTASYTRRLRIGFVLKDKEKQGLLDRQHRQALLAT
jgi:Ca2+-binding EF-hand superfamily protein